MIGGPSSKIWYTASLLPLYPCDPMFQDTAFSIVFVSMEPSIWRFDVQPILGVMVSLFECIFTHRFHLVCIGARLTGFGLAYVPAKPNIFCQRHHDSSFQIMYPGSYVCVQGHKEFYHSFPGCLWGMGAALSRPTFLRYG